MHYGPLSTGEGDVAAFFDGLETADITLMSDLSRLPSLYELPHDASGIIRQNTWGSLVSKAAFALAGPFGLVPIWATVLIRDSEMTLGVIENAMRLSQIAPERMHSEVNQETGA